MMNFHIRPLPRAILFLLAFALNTANQVVGQQFSITAGSINTCVGVLEDSGGPAASYGNNENFTVVICPSTPGDAISLFWAVFNLDQSGAQNSWDQIQIWDGDVAAGGPTLGNYTGAALQGLTVSATTFNPSGCLTVRFISNGTGVGDFAASITCFTPCDRPTAVAFMSEPVPALVCVGEVVDFNGTGSYAATGFNIVQYTWDFDDGAIAFGPTTTHSFAEPGEYIVQLNLLDDNDCVNSNVVDLQILVSTTPSFEGTMESLQTCLGATVNLTAVVTPVTWSGIPEANFGDGVFLPDDVGTPFSSELDFSQFDPGQILSNVNDLLSVCVSMEHSFMGDLVLSLTCPSGQSIIFHQQGGGGTYIGGANDGDSNANPVPGTCWEYCWSPTATNGTWVQSVAAGMTMQGGTPPNNALIPGTYSPVQPFTNLQGCPLNGTWTFTSLDLWGADNGFLCNWSINFNPAIIPDVTQFTPDLGTSTVDSAYWSGPDLTLEPGNPLAGTATPTASGSFDYSFYVTDNFGCTYDTTVTVIVAPQMVVDAGPDIVLCSTALPMAAQVVSGGAAPNCTWTLQLNESFGDAWNGGANVALIINGVSTSYAIGSGGVFVQTANIAVTTGATIVVQYTEGTIFNNENSFTLFDDQGQTIFASTQGPATGQYYSGVVICSGGSGGPTTWLWSPIAGLDDPTSPTTPVFVTQPTWYTVAAYPVGSPECAVTDSVLVSPDPSIDAGLNNAFILCASNPIFLLTDSLNGTPDAGGVWTNAFGVVVPDLFDPLTGESGVYNYTVTSANGCVATAIVDITIIPAADPACCGIPDAGLPNYSCNLTIALNGTPGNTGVGNWTGPAGAVYGNVFAPQTTVTMPIGSGGAHWFYWVENDGAFCNLIDSVQMTLTDDILIDFTFTDAICFTYCDGTAQSTMTGGNAAVAFNYDWSNGDGGPGIADVDGLCAGTYTLTITDDNGCTGSNSVTISEPVLLVPDSLASIPVTCFGDCDGRVFIFDAEAVAYSFNDGATWSTDPVLVDLCAGFYPILIRDAADCIGTGLIAVTGPPPVEAQFEWGPIPANVDDPVIQFANTSTGSETYAWTFYDVDNDILGSSTLESPSWRFPNVEPGEYDVCLIAWNYNNCVDTICNKITIDDVLFTYVPNSFTPDGDGLNDGFRMETNIPVITDFEMLIFDRWGQVLFETSDPYEYWFGKYRNGGEVLKTEVYVYRIMFEVSGTLARKELMGSVTLLK